MSHSLRLIDKLPPGILDVTLKDIMDLFPQPTVIDLPGRRDQPLFASILLHGNEDAGLIALQELLKRYTDRQLPRRLIVFVGNVQACRAGKRFLPDQVDFNRAWPGSELPNCETHELLQSVTNYVLQKQPFASIDIHNNTGLNPYYGCICTTKPAHLYLASMFSRTAVFFTSPRGVQTQAFMDHCPAITCECGQIGDRVGALRAAELLDSCLHLSEFPDPSPPAELTLFHTVARIRLNQQRSFGFKLGGDIVLRGDLQSLNFVELLPGEPIATIQGALNDCFEVTDEKGKDVTVDYLTLRQDVVQLSRPSMPSMLTHNVDVIKQDCLGYLMERYPLT
ncbi:MAG: succinylglutamate desuccinylase/aspartoacylase family protein [Planctomycetales bacterium]|nr:succinylglutamate desuccinylase/aspartoacylase family protein [Planctomycetales bacterium]